MYIATRSDETTGPGSSHRDVRGKSVSSRATACADAARKEVEALGEQKARVGVCGTRSRVEGDEAWRTERTRHAESVAIVRLCQPSQWRRGQARCDLYTQQDRLDCGVWILQRRGAPNTSLGERWW